VGTLTETTSPGIGSFHVHRGHAFAGFELRPEGVLVALCDCGELLDVADAAFARCPECAGASCPRCGGTGAVVDHASLVWRQVDAT
jgi:hypothetical protein